MADLIRRNLPAPTRGLVDGINPARADYPLDASPSLNNIRVTGGEWAVRKGNALFSAIVDSGGDPLGDDPTHSLHCLYKGDGTRFYLAARNGGLVYFRPGTDTFWRTAEDGDGWAGATNSGLPLATYQGETFKNEFYFTTGEGRLLRFNFADRKLYYVAMPDPPGAARVPQVGRRVQGVLEGWEDDTDLPPSWVLHGSQIDLIGVDDSDTGPPRAPVGDGRRAQVQWEDSNADGDYTDRSDFDVDVSETNFVGLVAYQDTDDGGTFFSLRGGQGEDDDDIQSIEMLSFENGKRWEVFLLPTGELQRLTYLAFKCEQDAPSPGPHFLYLSKIYLCGNLDGEYRWLWTYYDSTTGRESAPSAAMLKQKALDFTLDASRPNSLKKVALIGLKGQAYGEGTDKIRPYRNGGTLSLDSTGNARWTLLPDADGGADGVTNFSTVLDGAASATDTTIDVEDTRGITANSDADATDNWIVLSLGSDAAREFVQVDSITPGSGNAGTLNLRNALIHDHADGAAVDPAYWDNNPDEAIAGNLQLDTTRTNPPEDVQWAARIGERLWLFLESEVWVSAKPTPDRPYDFEAFNDSDPFTRLDPLAGWSFAIPTNAGGDKIAWGGTFQGIPTVLTRKSLFRINAFSQTDWASASVGGSALVRSSAVTPILKTTGCLNGRTVAEADGVLIWVTEGPRVVMWDGQGPPRVISHQRISATLESLPSGGWENWHAHVWASPEGHRYSLFCVEEGATYAGLRLDYHLEEDLWEVVTAVSGSETTLTYRGAAVQNGPGEIGALVGFRTGSEVLYRFDDPARVTDYVDADNDAVSIPWSWRTKRVTMGEPGLVCLAHEAVLRLEGVGDTAVLTATAGGSDYPEASQGGMELDFTGSGDVERRLRLPRGLRGEWLEVEASGESRHGLAVREVQLVGVPWRFGRTGNAE